MLYIDLCRFNKLTDRFFKNSPWPNADVIAPFVDEGNILTNSSLPLP